MVVVIALPPLPMIISVNAARIIIITTIIGIVHNVSFYFLGLASILYKLDASYSIYIL